MAKSTLATLSAFIIIAPLSLPAQELKIDWDEAVACFEIKAEDVHRSCPGTTGSVASYASWRKHPPEVVHRARDLLERIALSSRSEAARGAAVISLVVRGGDRPESETLERLQRIYEQSDSPTTRLSVVRQAPVSPEPTAFSRLMEAAVRDTRQNAIADHIAGIALERLAKSEVGAQALQRLKADVENLPARRARQVLAHAQ